MARDRADGSCLKGTRELQVHDEAKKRISPYIQILMAEYQRWSPCHHRAVATSWE